MGGARVRAVLAAATALATAVAVAVAVAVGGGRGHRVVVLGLLGVGVGGLHVGHAGATSVGGALGRVPGSAVRIALLLRRISRGALGRVAGGTLGRIAVLLGRVAGGALRGIARVTLLGVLLLRGVPGSTLGRIALLLRGVAALLLPIALRRSLLEALGRGTTLVALGRARSVGDVLRSEGDGHEDSASLLTVVEEIEPLGSCGRGLIEGKGDLADDIISAEIFVHEDDSEIRIGSI